MATPILFFMASASFLRASAIPNTYMPHSSLFLPLLHTPTPLSSFPSSTFTNRLPHSSLFLPFLHTPTPRSSFPSSTFTNRLPHSSLFLFLLQLNTLLLLPTPFLADLCPRALHASDSPLLSHSPFP